MMNERLSEWVDGELERDEGERAARAVLEQGASRETCELYWLIGDVMRGHAAASPDLGARVMAALEAEPTVLAPRPKKHQAAKTGAFDRWLPAAAAVAGVAVAAWMSFSLIVPAAPGGQEAPLAATIAARPAAAVAPEAAPTPVALSGDQAYYMAHQASAMGAPMVGVAQYIRTVGDEQAGNR
ncbi:MAG: sigma-E factor negative regulatory protein [Candidatus Dactylopiibacterium sp.]|nr:sigma-E factor negative regulatory protein [Candidatus Dactylopiibacterium sp.]